MPQVQGLSVHVNGPAWLLMGFGSGGLQYLGLTESGVDLLINYYLEEVPADTAGPRVPADLLDAAMDAEISARMVFWDQAQLDFLAAQGDADAVGTQGTVGLPMGATQNTVRLVIQSDLDIPWRFFTTIMRGPQRVRLSTKHTPFDLRLYSWTLLTGTDKTAKGKKLFDHTNA